MVGCIQKAAKHSRQRSFRKHPLVEAVAQRCSVKKMFLEMLLNSQKTPVPESL